MQFEKSQKRTMQFREFLPWIPSYWSKKLLGNTLAQPSSRDSDLLGLGLGFGPSNFFLILLYLLLI